MPRPQKMRHVCCMPKNQAFVPANERAEATIVMTIDEYETIRLIDLEGCTQEEAAKQMQVARTTVQGIYGEARRKLADAIVNGKKLTIYGGDYRLCEGYGKTCENGCTKRCHKRQCQR